MIYTLAQDASEFYALVKSGGPFLVAFFVLYFAGLHFYKSVMKPSREVDLAISNNQAKAAGDMKEMAADLRASVSESKETLIEIKAWRDEKRRAAMTAMMEKGRDPLHDSD